MEQIDQPISYMPFVEISEDEANKIKKGQKVETRQDYKGFIRIYSLNKFMGVGSISNGFINPERVINL